MNLMTYKGYHARVDYDGDDEVFIGHIAGINDVIGFHADTVEALKAAFMKPSMIMLQPVLRSASRRTNPILGG